MTAVDTNIMVYAHRRDTPEHKAARNCLSQLADSPAAWAIPWPCVHEFLGVVTNPKFYRSSSTMAEAIGEIEGWMESPSLRMIGETTGHWSHLKQLLTNGKIVGPMTHDARIAAICCQNGVTRFLTADRDFSRFPDLHTVNPLVS